LDTEVGRRKREEGRLKDGRPMNLKYDKNMVEYITTSNTFFKPNAFRPAFSTVDGGYGTFGAISSNLFVVPSSN